MPVHNQRREWWTLFCTIKAGVVAQYPFVVTMVCSWREHLSKHLMAQVYV